MSAAPIVRQRSTHRFEFDALADGAQNVTLPLGVRMGSFLVCINGLSQSPSTYSISGSSLTLPASLSIKEGDLVSFDCFP